MSKPNTLRLHNGYLKLRWVEQWKIKRIKENKEDNMERDIPREVQTKDKMK